MLLAADELDYFRLGTSTLAAQVSIDVAREH